jgi:hypothetical protein
MRSDTLIKIESLIAHSLSLTRGPKLQIMYISVICPQKVNFSSDLGELLMDHNRFYYGA